MAPEPQTSPASPFSPSPPRPPFERRLQPEPEPEPKSQPEPQPVPNPLLGAPARLASPQPEPEPAVDDGALKRLRSGVPTAPSDGTDVAVPIGGENKREEARALRRRAAAAALQRSSPGEASPGSDRDSDS